MSTGIQFLDRIPPVTRSLIIINVIVWAFTAVFPAKADALLNLGALHYFTSPGFNPAQLFTYMCIHGGFTHLFFNMFALWMFGSMLEWQFGQRRYLFFYISCGLGAALLQEGIYAIRLHSLTANMPAETLDYIVNQGWQALSQNMNFTDPQFGQINALVNGSTVGASGAIYGILAGFGLIYPDRPLFIMFIPVPVKAKWVVLGYALLEFSLGFGNVHDNIAHYAHLGGMAIGALIIFIWKHQAKSNGGYF